MGKKVKIGWDVSHQEFTIEDHYYYSILKSKIKESGASVKEVHSINDFVDYDVLVVNYPEKIFKSREVKQIKSLIEMGKRVIACGYYNNEDRVSDNINSISSYFGLSLEKDVVKDKLNNFKGDDLLIVTSRVLSYDYKINKVLFPCCASVKAHGKSVNTIALSERSSVNSSNLVVLAAEASIGLGKFILIGTCVFWDNYAIKKYSNLRFSLNLLLGY